MSAKYSNPGTVDVERAVEGILDAGGGMKSVQKDGYIHNTAYSKDENYHLSYNTYPDGSIGEVHTDKGGSAYMQYGGGK